MESWSLLLDMQNSEKLLKSSGLHDAYIYDMYIYIYVYIYICLYHVKKNKVDDLYHKNIIYIYIYCIMFYIQYIYIYTYKLYDT